MDRDNSVALQEQEALLQAIEEDSVCVEIFTGHAIGASLLAFNQIARQHGKGERSPQEWAELAIHDGLLAIKRTWEYSAKTRNNKAFVEEMRAITKLFTLPPTEHPKYHDRLQARFDAEQACRSKYGIQ